MELSTATREKITKKAYERFIARGKKEGFALEDWIVAEKEVLGQDLRVSKPVEKPQVREQFTTRKNGQRPVTGMKVTSYA